MNSLDLTKIKPAPLGYLIHGLIMWIYLWGAVMLLAGPLNAFVHDGVWVWPTVDLALLAGKLFFVVIVFAEIGLWLEKRWFPSKRNEGSPQGGISKDEQIAEEEDAIIGDQWKLPPR